MNGTSGTSLILQSNNLSKGFVTVDNDGLEVRSGVNSTLRVRSNGDGMYFYPNGQISIGGGGQTATGYVVSIEGKAIAAEFKVQSVASWPDYVFADNYTLNPLSYVKDFIAKNKHLPNIPAAAEIEKNGMEMGDMTKRLLEKVEELTLYIIDLQEQLNEMKKNNQHQRH